MFSEFLFSHPPFASCHAPTIAETDKGLLAAWFGGKSEGHRTTGIWISSKTSSGWTEPVEVANGKQPSGRSFACWNPVLLQRAGGGLLLFYKVGKAPSIWRGMLASSEDAGTTWSAPRELPRRFFGPTKNKPMELRGGSLLCPSSDEIFDYWRIQFELLGDDGWRRVDVPARGLACIQPTLLRHSDTTLQALCRTANGVIAETWSHDEGESWSLLVETDLPNPNSAIDAVSLGNREHILVYNNSKRWRSSLVVAISNDGSEWRRLVTLEDEDGEFSYPSVIKGSGGRVHIVYTWKRRNIKHVMLDRELPRRTPWRRRAPAHGPAGA